MTNKILIGGLVVIAFVAGSMMTITADAKQEDNTAFFGLLMELETQIISMQTQIQQLDFLGETGDKGADGDKGATGDKGETGDAGQSGTVYTKQVTETVANGATRDVIAHCNSGDIAISGGFGNPSELVHVESKPHPSSERSWINVFHNQIGGQLPATTYVRCMDTTP